MNSIKTQLADIYLTYINEFLTVRYFAKYHGMEVGQACALLDLGGKFHEERVAEQKQKEK